jgi:hypothetical protein
VAEGGDEQSSGTASHSAPWRSLKAAGSYQAACASVSMTPTSNAARGP